MTAGTKVTIAIVVLFATVLGIYYGFGGPKGASAGGTAIMPAAEDDPAAQEPQVGQDAPLGTVGSGTGGDPGWSTVLNTADGGAGSVLASDGWGGMTAEGPEAGGGEVTVQPVLGANDPWVLRAPTLMPEPETAVAKTQTSVGPARTIEYVVQEDDSMWTIADRWFEDPTRWQEIARANPGINPDRLRVGQRLYLPAQKTAGPVGLNRAVDLENQGPAPAQRAAGRTYYSVRSGDTLSMIAQKYYQSGSRWRVIYDANRSAIGRDPNRLKVGTRLVIPPG